MVFDTLDQAIHAFEVLSAGSNARSFSELVLKFFPFVLLLELPLYLLVVAGIARYGVRRLRRDQQREKYPSVSCLITCYSEGDDVSKTIGSLAHQMYRGHIEIIALIDGAVQNKDTYLAATSSLAAVNALPNRRLIVLPKWQRGGRVSSLNAGLSIATGEVVMALDGDTSFDNDMVAQATRHFDDPNVVALAGCLRVRNAADSLVARLQALEYMLSIGAGKTGLAEFNIINNISGAFGVFRTSFIRNMGGWDAGTAEDLDITMRIKQYFGQNPKLRIAFEPHAVGHTDAPTSWRVFFRQRLRWDGDLYYLFVRKYLQNIRPGLLGWRNFLFTLVNGFLMQVIMPFFIVFYTGLMLWYLPLGSVLGVLAFVYLIYLASVILFFLLYVVAISERPGQDIGYVVFLPLVPLFAFATRVNSALSLLQEAVLKSHLDSSMAPWWVLKKTKF
ncbi:glycosyltransferase family 2 protein [Diaphorobacter aerolatus]|uniref:Glycosyltransferase family 2 protein n=1 Tax=Diaphorobacter aerolatus TaxID=1288495 RepID=A0A7H0GL85_9BURK|nr:glycosyltransferase [Diaphorobacter aerolatus]QNP49051.1 glycosyltransferase family 2 protein [Diaphorobacter aerolatus]